MVAKLSEEIMEGSDLTLDEVTVEVDDGVLDTIDVGSKKKRRPRARAPFRSWLVKVGKAKFGTPRKTEGNRMCVRKYLYDHCVEHGVLARHVWENVDIATEMVFVPTDMELQCAAIQSVPDVRAAHRLMDSFGRPYHGVA
jgi:hypothetical protein